MRRRRVNRSQLDEQIERPAKLINEPTAGWAVKHRYALGATVVNPIVNGVLQGQPAVFGTFELGALLNE